MEGKVSDVSQVFDRFKAAYTRNDLSTCSTLLSQLKVTLIGFPSLLPLYCESPAAIHELTLARDIFEHAFVLSVKTKDQDAFQRDFLQLKPYYTDTKDLIPPSAQEYPILGLNLLHLLVQSRIAEFHIELNSFTLRHLRIYALSTLPNKSNHSWKVPIIVFSVLGKQSRTKLGFISWTTLQILSEMKSQAVVRRHTIIYHYRMLSKY